MEKVLAFLCNKNKEIINIIKNVNKEFCFDNKNLTYLLSNMAHESSFFTRFEENLNYTTISRLKKVFPSFFKDKSDAYISGFVKNPKALGDLVYGGRYGNSSKDGYKYRGRGCLQTTFLDNYNILSKITKIDFVNNPDLLKDPYYAVKSAFIFYNEMVFKKNKNSTLREVRKVIAGSYFGYNEVNNVYVMAISKI